MTPKEAIETILLQRNCVIYRKGGVKMLFTMKDDSGEELVLNVNSNLGKPNQGKWMYEIDKIGKHHTFCGEFVDKSADYEDAEKGGTKMERLTEKNDNGKAYLTPYVHSLHDAINKLAEYEDLEERLNEKFFLTLEKMVDVFIEFYDQQEKDEELADCMLITNDNVRKYKAWKEAEEQGLLLRVPCKVGDDVYFIPNKVNYKLNILDGISWANKVYHQKVAQIVTTKNGWYAVGDIDLEHGTGKVFVDRLHKETWFLSKEEAEQALANMESWWNK